jgi:hypothetical protein
MDGHSNGFSSKGLCLFKLLLDRAKRWHKVLNPKDLHASVLCQGHISYNIQAYLPFSIDFVASIP